MVERIEIRVPLWKPGTEDLNQMYELRDGQRTSAIRVEVEGDVIAILAETPVDLRTGERILRYVSGSGYRKNWVANSIRVDGLPLMPKATVLGYVPAPGTRSRWLSAVRGSDRIPSSQEPQRPFLPEASCQAEASARKTQSRSRSSR